MIINMIQERLSIDRREFYGLKKVFALKYHEKINESTLLGKLEKKNNADAEKLTFQHQAVNQLTRKEINHHRSHHTLELQMSQYV